MKLEFGHHPQAIDSQDQPLELEEAVKGLDPEANLSAGNQRLRRLMAMRVCCHQLLDQQLQ